VKTKELDITNYESHTDFYFNLEPKPVGVIIVSGYMSEQKLCENDWTITLNTIEVNYTGAVSFLNIVANDMEHNKKGFIVGVSSVAGERGRKANYIYGSSKAAFTSYLSGLRNRLYNSKVHVLTVKPGFVATKMTAGLNLPLRLTAKPDEVAKDIYYAQQKGKDVLYSKSIWSIIMLIIRCIPEWKFKSMNV
jgi:short-subunit dehydrogenase